MILAAFAAEPLPPEQIGSFAGRIPSSERRCGSGIAPLLDRLGTRLGLDALSRLEPRESHIPERASVRVSALIHQPPSSIPLPRKSGERVRAQRGG